MDTKDRFETGLKLLFFSTFGSREVFFKRGLSMAAFIQEGKMVVNKDWLTMAVSRGTISLEHSNSKDVGIGSRSITRFIDICFMNFTTVSLVMLSSPHKRVPEKRRSPRLQGGNEQSQNEIMDLANLVDKVKKDLWKLISGVGRRQWGECNLA